MMCNQEYLCELFGRHFYGFKNKRIVIYGLSANTQTILSLHPQYNFIALLDSTVSEGSMYNLPIVPLDSVSRLNADCIIIVARANSTKIIARNIADFCRNNVSIP